METKSDRFMYGTGKPRVLLTIFLLAALELTC